ncbi:Dxs [Paenibacillus mucilaginosus 3016]|uniref:Dxs n=1 Tax=Paenibacillus mucilaginosus 3016 TaxID=1116391 RepID=H6NL88_9BACL|nr:Dxs [Paenibacillus mucilaginosus 3016]
MRVVNARFIKPMDEAMLHAIAKEDIPVITVEEGTQLGGFGSGVLEYYSLQGIYGLRIKLVGVPDYFVEHGSVKEQRQEVGLTAERLVQELQTLVPRRRQRA